MSDVLVQVTGSCGRITLNRPRAMNALSITMVEADPRRSRGVGERRPHPLRSRRWCRRARTLRRRRHTRAVQLHCGQPAGAGNGLLPQGIPAQLRHLAVPEALCGVDGRSRHGRRHRHFEPWITPRRHRTLAAGHARNSDRFIPDVGGTHLLGTVPGELGTWMGLTGGRIGAADAIQCGLADTMVRSEDLPRLTLELEACTDAPPWRPACEVTRPRRLRACQPSSAPGWTSASRQPTVEEIVASLLEHPAAEAQASARELMKMSPTSLKLTLNALRKARAANDLATSSAPGVSPGTGVRKGS